MKLFTLAAQTAKVQHYDPICADVGHAGYHASLIPGRKQHDSEREYECEETVGFVGQDGLDYGWITRSRIADVGGRPRHGFAQALVRERAQGLRNE